MSHPNWKGKYTKFVYSDDEENEAVAEESVDSESEEDEAVTEESVDTKVAVEEVVLTDEADSDDSDKEVSGDAEVMDDGLIGRSANKVKLVMYQRYKRSLHLEQEQMSDSN